MSEDINFASDVVEEVASSVVEPLNMVTQLIDGTDYVISTSPGVFYYNKPPEETGSIIESVEEERYRELVDQTATSIEIGTIFVGGLASLDDALKYVGKKVDDVGAKLSGRNVDDLILNLGSTGRTTATSLVEQLAMEEAKSNPTGGTFKIITETLSDGRWDSWQKRAKNINGVEIHYNVKIENGVVTAVDDFKFK